jgi:hypothetical protein
MIGPVARAQAENKTNRVTSAKSLIVARILIFAEGLLVPYPPQLRMTVDGESLDGSGGCVEGVWVSVWVCVCKTCRRNATNFWLFAQAFGVRNWRVPSDWDFESALGTSHIAEPAGTD